MTCNSTSQLCEHLLCEDSIENGIINTEPTPWTNDEIPRTAMGHTATIGCKEGYVIDHPAKMTVLARSGYNIQGSYSMPLSIDFKTLNKIFLISYSLK